jgi:drug/metabolite transporter (DMT)-like permease
MKSTLARLRRLDRQGPLVTWAALGIVYTVWGSTYLGIRLAIDTIPPLLMAGVRFLLAGAVLYALTARVPDPERRGGRRWLVPTRRHWLAALIAGGLLFVGGNGGVVLGESALPSGTVALMIATVPLWMTLIAALCLREPLSRWTLLGVAVGLAGVALLVQPAGGARFQALPTAAVLLSPVFWASGSLYSRRAPLPALAGPATAMQMLAGGAILVLAGAATGELPRLHPAHLSTSSLLAMLYLVVFGSLLAFSAYALVLRRLPTTVVATYAYVNPVVAVGLGWAFLAEPVTPRLVLSGGIILAAVAIIVSAGARAAAAQRSAAGFVGGGQGADVGDGPRTHPRHGEQVAVAHGIDGGQVAQPAAAEGVADAVADQPRLAEALQG